MINDAGVVYIYIYDLLEQYSTGDYVNMAVKHCRNRENAAMFRGITYTDASFEIRRTASGKPYFPDCENIRFSVSHSGAFFVCALSEQNIGVDLERRSKLPGESDVDTSIRLCKIADRFFHPNEAVLIKTDPMTRFYEVFTAKESYVKYLGTGFDDAAAENSILPDPGLLPSCHQSEGAVSWKSADVQFWQTVYLGDYVLCFCTAGSNMIPKVNIIDLRHLR